MPYFVIENFRAGVDTRSPVYAAEPGTLSVGTDVHLTRGGHIEVRKEFVEVATLPANTFGLHAIGNDLFTFGSVEEPAGFPVGYFYRRLQHPNGDAMTDILDVELFDGKFYVIGEYTNDTVHFFDGTRIADWTIIGEAAANPPYSPGRAARTAGSKMYVLAGPNMQSSKVADPTAWDPATDTGASVTNLSTHSTGAEELIGAELYYENLAVMSAESIQIWAIASDPTENRRVQTLRGAGLVGSRATISYLDGDTFLLSYQGVKAIAPKDSSGRSTLESVSAPVDKELIAYLQSLSEATLSRALMLVEPEDNRLWVILGQRIYVRSWFPDRQIKAWTEYHLDFEIDAATIKNRRVYVRSGDKVYLYGGADNDTYFSGEAVARLPYVGMRAPATYKDLHAFDAGVVGTWEVWAGQRPDQEDTFERVAVITGQTFDQPEHPIVGDTTHLSLEFRHDGTANPEAASINAIALHFQSNASS